MKIKAQVMVSTLLILIVVSMTVLAVTSTVVRNSRQVSRNKDYDRAYNNAESRIIELSSALSVPTLDLNDVSSISNNPALEDYDCDSRIIEGTPKITCAIDETDGKRTLISFFDSKIVENYELGTQDYFDIILNNGNISPYKGKVSFKWVGIAAISLVLIYEDGGELKSAEQIIDPSRIDFDPNNDILTTHDPTKGFLRGQLTQAPNPLDTSAFEISLGSEAINSDLVPTTAVFQKLRIKMYSRAAGTSITIRPDPSTENNFPFQVRRVEGISYDLQSPTASIPTVLSQFPLSPQTPAPLTFGLNFDALQTPVCGNGMIEGAEECDDGNTDDTDKCTNSCESYICKLSAAAGRNKDYFLEFDVTNRRGKAVHIDLNPNWEEDFIEMYALRTDGTKETLIPGGCYGGTGVIYDTDPAAGTALVGWDWLGDKSFSETGDYGFCTIVYKDLVEHRTLIKENWDKVVLKIVNGQDACGAPNTSWELRIKCPKPNDPLKTKQNHFQWIGQCGPGCGPEGCD